MEHRKIVFYFFNFYICSSSSTSLQEPGFISAFFTFWIRIQKVFLVMRIRITINLDCCMQVLLQVREQLPRAHRLRDDQALADQVCRRQRDCQLHICPHQGLHTILLLRLIPVCVF